MEDGKSSPTNKQKNAQEHHSDDAWIKDKELLSRQMSTLDASAIVLQQLAQEILQIEEKYGTKSKLLEKKKDQLKKLRELYDNSLDYINFLRTHNLAMYSEFMMAEVIRHSRDTGMPVSKIMSLCGDDSGVWQSVDKLDTLISDLKIKMGFKTDPETTFDFNDFITRMREKVRREK